MMLMLTHTKLIVCLMLVCCLSPLPAFGDEGGGIKVLLIGMEHYERSPLKYISQDVSQVAFTLMNRHNCEASLVTDTAAATGDQGPARHRKSIMDKISRWSKQFTVKDTAILYLGGHGVRDKSGCLYLAMINFNGKNYDEAAIPMQWIRDQIAECPAQCKLLILDTCYAGTAKGGDFDQPSTEDMAKSFDKLENVTTIASSRGDQQSWIWRDKEHSLFTYWLIEAIKGHADKNADLTVTLSELTRYIKDNVSWIADVTDATQGNKQTPVVLHPEKINARFRLLLKPIPFEQLIDDMAEQIDVQMRAEKFEAIGIPEFATGNTREATINAQYGSLPRYAANKLTASLAKKRRGAYVVLSAERVQKMLRDRGITAADLGTEKVKYVAIEGRRIPVLVAGRMRLFNIANVSIRARLLETNWNSEVGQSGGLGMISKLVLADTEINVVMPERQHDENGPPPSSGEAPPLAQQIEEDVAEMRQHARQGDVLNDPDCKFKVYFRIRRQRRSDKKPENSDYTTIRKPEYIDGAYYIPVSKGERYAIIAQCKTGKPVFARVLVDGLNTLAQKMDTVEKGFEIVHRDRPDWQIAPCVSLAKARAWYLEKASPYGIFGFYDDKGTHNDSDDTLNRFRIEDADQAVATRKNYTKQLGLITVAFFESAPNERSGRGNDGKIATAMDPAERVQLEHYKGTNVPGKLLAVFNIRYVTPGKLRQIKSQSQTNTQ